MVSPSPEQRRERSTSVLLVVSRLSMARVDKRIVVLLLPIVLVMPFFTPYTVNLCAIIPTSLLSTLRWI